MTAPFTTCAQMLTAVGRVESTELTFGPLRDDELLVEVRATGVCGSDRAAFLGTHPYKRAPSVLGHEMSGVVVQTGGAVQGIAVGDSVSCAAFAHCNECGPCERGAIHLCSDKASLSHGGWSGTFAEHVVLRERMVVLLPDDLSAEAGALVEPLSIGAHAVSLVAGRDLGTAVILGAGTIGLAALLAARGRGVERLICVDRGPLKGKLAARVGASAYIDASGPTPAVSAVLAAVPGPVDVTFVAAGYDGVLDDAVAVTRPGGAIVLISYFDTAQRVDLNAVVARGITVFGSALCTQTDLAQVSASLAAGDIDPTTLITHSFPLERAQEALELMVAHGEQVGKVMLLPGRNRG